LWVLEDTLFVAAPTFRSRAYAQRMVDIGIVPSLVLALPGEEPDWEGPSRLTVELEGVGDPPTFSPGEPALATLTAAGVPTLEAANADVNSEDVIHQLQGLDQSVAIYSGFGGVILGRTLLECGPRFLHVHGGWAPAYRGSTAFYYSLLREGTVGATALWLEAEIDAGPILMRSAFRPPAGVEIDRAVDPVVRSHLLGKVLEERSSRGDYWPGFHDHEGAETYHVIHPVLKHLALRRCGLVS
jgi:methionyl-tRNA formyltransferase